MQLRHPAVVAVEEGEEVLGEVALVLLRQAAHDAEIHRDVARPIGMGAIDEDVARMHVGVEEVVAHQLGEEDLHPALGERPQIDAGGAQRIDVADRDPRDPLHHHHPAPRVLPVHFRHVEQIGALEVAPQLRGRRRLALQIELVEDGLLVLGHDLPRTKPARIGPVSMREPRHQVQQAHVAPDDLLDPRTHHLDHHLPAVLEPRRVDLRDRRRRQRLAGELAEDLLHRTAERIAHDPGRGLAGERRHAILEVREFIGDVLREQVAAGREDLAELDEDGSEILQRAPQPHRPGRLRAADPVPGQEVEEETNRAQQVRPEHDLVEAVPYEHDVDVYEPQNLAGPDHRSGSRRRSSRAVRASRRSTSSRRSSTACAKRSTSPRVGASPAS